MPTSQALLERSKQHQLVRLLDDFLKDVIPIEDQLAWLFGKFHKTRAKFTWALPKLQFNPVFFAVDGKIDQCVL